jgi:hypothetical protein
MGVEEGNRVHCVAVRPRFLVIALVIALAACSSKPEAPIDPNLFPTGYKNQVAGFLRTYLNNPTKVRDAAISEPALKMVGGAPRYVSCVRYNARDVRNQYQGIEEKAALFLAGSLNQFLPANRELCANAVYQRFPEAEVLVP